MNGHLHTLIGAHAANAVTTRERESFEKHLPDCAHCAQETRELQETVALLGAAAAAPVPPQLRPRLMATVARTRQDPPLRHQPTTRPSADVSGVVMSRARRCSLSAAACLAVLSIGLGGYATQLRGDLSDLRQQDKQVAAVRTAPDARTVTATTGSATGTVTISKQADQMVFLSDGLPDLPRSRTYQIWFIGSDGPRSAGTFDPDKSHHDAKILSGMEGEDQLMVTNEPAPGTLRPTTAPVLRLDLRSI